MKKNNYLLPFSILFALGIVNKSNAQEALKAEMATTGTAAEGKAVTGTGFMALEGRITDGQGNGIAYATVTIKGTDRTVQADAWGNYRFAEVQTGSYTLTVTKQGYSTSELNLVIEMPKMKVEMSKVYSTPNTKSISASPVIKDVVLKASTV